MTITFIDDIAAAAPPPEKRKPLPSGPVFRSRYTLREPHFYPDKRGVVQVRTEDHACIPRQPGLSFKSLDGSAYAIGEHGQLQRLDKPRGNKKQRRKARRKAP
jgi:hypothetical protein